MIAALLPGFRELRVPLTAGALWIAAAWVATRLVMPGFDHKLWKSLVEVSGWAGVTATLGALAVVAYLLGILVANLNPVRFLTATPLKRDTEARADVAARVSTELSRARSRGVSPIKVLSLFPDLHDEERRRYSEAEREQFAINEVEYQDREGVKVTEAEVIAGDRWFFIESKQETLVKSVLDRSASSADHLMVQQKDLYDALDRKKAEGDFRIAAALPVGVTVVLLGYGFDSQLSHYAVPVAWVVGTIAFVGLSVTGYLLSTERDSTITRYVASGILKSPTLDAIRALN